MPDQLSLFSVALAAPEIAAQRRPAAPERRPPMRSCPECARMHPAWREGTKCGRCLKALAAERRAADQLDRDPHRYDPATAPWPEGF